MSSLTLRLAAIVVSGLLAAGCTSTASNTTMSGAPVASASALITPAAYAPTEANAADKKLARPYFISFRSRTALSYGHSFVVFGRFDSNGKVPYDSKGVLIPSMTEVAGLHPASTSNVPYTIGHLLPVPSETGWSDGDTELAYLTNELTVPLTEAQYRDVVAYIRDLQSHSPIWHAVLANCSGFIGKIASHLGMKTPNPMLYPKDYIAALKKINGYS